MKKGFTLIELIIVIVIIGILAAVALPRYFANLNNARRAEAVSVLSSLRDAELAEFARNGSYAALVGGALAVDINGDGTADIRVEPASQSFTYAVPAGNTTATATNRAGVPAAVYTVTFDTGAITCAGAGCGT